MNLGVNNSRYWVGPENPLSSADIQPLLNAFQNYNNPLIKFWLFLIGGRNA